MDEGLRERKGRDQSPRSDRSRSSSRDGGTPKSRRSGGRKKGKTRKGEDPLTMEKRDRVLNELAELGMSTQKLGQMDLSTLQAMARA